MATIGTFIKDREGFSGSIQTLTFKAKITIEPATKKNDTSPDFRVLHHTDAFTSDIGGAWKKNSRRNAEYLSLSIDDPSFPAPINCRLVKTGAEQGCTLFWDRPRD